MTDGGVEVGGILDEEDEDVGSEVVVVIAGLGG